MPAGRPRKPTILKFKQGTLQKSRQAKNEPQPEVLAHIPAPPRGLPAAGRRLWKRHAAELVALGLLSTVDLDAFEVGCRHYGMADELFQDMTHTTEGKGKKKRTVARTLAEYVNELAEPQLVDGVLQQKPAVYERLAVLYAMRALDASALKVFRDFGMTPAARSHIDLPTPEKPDASPVKRMMNA